MAKIPKRALSLMANTAKAVSKYGFKKGVSKAASKANPALLVIEAGISVLSAVSSFFDYNAAVKERGGLATVNVTLDERLRLDREVFEKEIENIKGKLKNKKEIHGILIRVVKICQEGFSEAMTIYQEMVNTDIPDLEKIEDYNEKLEEAWQRLSLALEQYQEEELD
jgi:hypothetical protein